MADYGRSQSVVGLAAVRRFLRYSAVGAGLCILLTLGSAGVAFGYGGGYGFPGFPGSGGGGGGFRNVVAAASVPVTGGSVSGSANGATISVVVSSGVFTKTEEVVISSESPCGLNVGGHDVALAVFGVSSLSPDSGMPNRGPVGSPLSVTITDKAISPGDSVVSVGSGAEIGGAMVTTGSAVFTIAQLPATFAIASPSWWKMASCFPHSGPPASHPAPPVKYPVPPVKYPGPPVKHPFPTKQSKPGSRRY